MKKLGPMLLIPNVVNKWCCSNPKEYEGDGDGDKRSHKHEEIIHVQSTRHKIQCVL